MSEGFEEIAGMGALEMLRAQTTALGDDDAQGTSSSQMSSYPVDSEGVREMGPQLTAVQPSGGKFLDLIVLSRETHSPNHTGAMEIVALFKFTQIKIAWWMLGV